MHLLASLLLIPLAVCLQILSNDVNVHYVNHCLGKMIKKLYKKDSLIVFMNFNELNCYLHMENPIMNVNLSQEIEIFKDYSYRNYVIFVHDLSQLRGDIYKLKFYINRDENLRGMYLIVTNEHNNISEILKFLWAEDIYEVIVLKFMDNYSDSIVLSSDPYDLNNYKSMVFDVFGNCNNVMSVTFGRYTPRGHHLNLTFCCYHVNLPCMGDLNSKTPGICIKALQIISKQLDMNLQILNGTIVYQVLLKNETISLIRHKVADLVLMMEYYAPYFRQYEVTSYFYYDMAIWIVAAPQKVSPMEIIFHTFTNQFCGWVVLIFIFGYFTLWKLAVWYKERDFSTATKCFLNIFAATVGGTFPMNIRNIRIRIFLIFYLFYAMHIGMYYHSVCRNALIKPKYKRGITSLEDVINYNVTPLIRVMHYYVFKQIGTSLSLAMVDNAVLLRSKHNVPHNTLKFISENRNYCIFSYESIYNMYRTETVRRLDGKFLQAQQLNFIMRKGHPLYEKIDGFIMTMRESGFFIQWLRELKNMTSIYKRKKIQNIVLSSDNLDGVYLLLFIGEALSFIIFLLEILYKKWTQRNAN